ncbi:MAG: CotH kinase family protein, partial [Lachnospiraceae bacterium]|nr:CotH kinase family protein [Lachnospiraceae bacterium]
FFMYKDIDSKLVFGPVWDFDWAWGNSMYGIDTAGMWNGTYTYARKWQTTNDYFANEQYYQTQQFNRLLVRDPYFIVKLYERYREVRESLILPFADEYESMFESLKIANGKNYTLWKRTDSSGGGAGRTYNEQLSHTLDFIRQRISWLDEQFTDPQTLIDSFGYYKASDCIAIGEPDTVSSPGNVLISVDVTGSIAAETAAVSFQVNGRTFITAPVEGGRAAASIPVSALTDDPGVYSTVVCRAVDVGGSYIKNSRGTEPGVYTNAHSGYIVIDEGMLGAAAGGSGDAGSSTDGSGDTAGNSADTDNGSPTGTAASENTVSAPAGSTSADGSFRPLIIAAIAAAVLAVTTLTALIIAKKRSKRS